MRIKGKVTSWHDEKGFGFIEPCAGGKRVFLHIKTLSRQDRRPVIGQLVTYTLSTDKQGRSCAVQGVLTGERLPQKTSSSNGSPGIIVAALFLSSVGIFVLTTRMPSLIFGLYVIASLLTFILYAIDKSAAQKGAWRTQESTLHLLALLGGWPGALVAQQKLQHKSKKKSFRRVFWVTVCINCGAFVWLFTPTGSSTMRALIASMV